MVVQKRQLESSIRSAASSSRTSSRSLRKNRRVRRKRVEIYASLGQKTFTQRVVGDGGNDADEEGEDDPEFIPFRGDEMIMYDDEICEMIWKDVTKMYYNKDYHNPYFFESPKLKDLERRFKINDKTETVSFLNTIELNEAIQSSELVICRSGYSSIMDLVKLKKKAILIPTPGQTEQEYLAGRLKEKRLVCVQDQATFSLNKGLIEAENFNNRFQQDYGQNQLDEIILSLKNQKFKNHLA